MDNLTYTLGGTDRDIVQHRPGHRSADDQGGMLNKEDKDTYMVTVTATDPSGLS